MPRVRIALPAFNSKNKTKDMLEEESILHKFIKDSTKTNKIRKFSNNNGYCLQRPTTLPYALITQTYFWDCFSFSIKLENKPNLTFNIVFFLFYDIFKYVIGVDARGVKGGGL